MGDSETSNNNNNNNMDQKDHSTSSSSSSNEQSFFTTTEFINKIKDTLMLANEIRQDLQQSNSSAKIQELLQLKQSHLLRVLTKLNRCHSAGGGGGGGSVSEKQLDFDRINLSDNEKMALVTELNDASFDKVLHHLDVVRGWKREARNPTKKSNDLVKVKMDMYKNNATKIMIQDFKSSSSSSSSAPSQSSTSLSNVANYKRKYTNDDQDGKQFPAKRFTFISSANIRRPQTVYGMKVDNAYSTPFIPKLTTKPNAIMSLEESLTPITYRDSANVTNTHSVMNEQQYGKIIAPTHHYLHPYRKEIESFEVSLDFLDRNDDAADRLVSPSSEAVGQKTFRFVQTKEQLIDLVADLSAHTEIAVDLEHHSFRTYQGITCLMQISTDDIDYIVDVFPLWHDMQMLNKVFTNPHILKVFHGATFDIIWLQRDFGIYVVNMFDTGIAAKMLNYDHLSLSSLVARFCNFQLDKRFQLADWRMRPLPAEMLNYARYDTYFLLYIYRKLKHELLCCGDESANLLRVVMDKCKDLCLKRYEKRTLESNDHYDLVLKHNIKLNSAEMAALKSLYAWRDYVARNEDESTGYVLPNNLLLKLCQTLPREQQSILACCNPIPPLVRQNINEIHRIILHAYSIKMATKAGGGGGNGGGGGVTNNMAYDPIANAIARKRTNMSIDLSIDRLIDDGGHIGHHDSKMKIDHDDGEHDHDQHVVPLFTWSSDNGRFELTQHSFALPTKMEIEDQNDDDDKQKTSKKSTMSDMFVSNISAHIQENIKQRQQKTKVDQLFADYVSPFERYQQVMQRRSQKNQ